jgi:cardiolipin synthase
MNPYLTDPGIIDGIVAAAQRGVHVRVLVPKHSNNEPAQYALEHSYDRLLSAGIEIWEHPAVMHAKVIVADGLIIVGTINLDAWALYRDLEIGLIINDPQIASTFRGDFIEPQILRSVAAEVPNSLGERVRNWLMRRIVYFL